MRKVQITTSTAGKKVTKTYDHFNENLSDSDCLTFATTMNALSDATVKKVVRTDKTDITNATAVDPSDIRANTITANKTDLQIKVGESDTVTCTATVQPENAVPVYELVNSPDWATVDSDTGVVTFNATGVSQNAYSFTVKASARVGNVIGTGGTCTVSISVTVTSSTPAPTPTPGTAD